VLRVSNVDQIVEIKYSLASKLSSASFSSSTRPLGPRPHRDKAFGASFLLTGMRLT